MEQPMTRRYGIALFCLFATGCVAAPGYQFPGVRGQILDSATNAPIAGAIVSVTPFGGSALVLTSTSDASGRFEVNATRSHFYTYPPPPATQSWVDAHLDVSAAGYDAQRLPLLNLTKRSLPETKVSLIRR